MASYNAWNHVPMTVNPVIHEVVIKQWGATASSPPTPPQSSKWPATTSIILTSTAALAAAIKAGIGQILTFVPALKGACNRRIKANLLTEADIDNALRGKFRTVIWLGLLDPPAHNPYVAIGEQQVSPSRGPPLTSTKISRSSRSQIHRAAQEREQHTAARSSHA